MPAVYWDLKRQFLPRSHKLAWLAVVGRVPGLGLAAYLLSRLFSRAFPLPPTGGPPGTAKRRVTQLRRAPEGEVRTGTMAAAEAVQETVADRRLVGPMGVTVAVVAGPHAGQEFLFGVPPAQLGRGSEAALRLDRDKALELGDKIEVGLSALIIREAVA